jgi:RHS repeat-associated protein
VFCLLFSPWFPTLKIQATETKESTIYVNKYFEVRDHDAPTKYVFNGDTRVARITGSLSANARVQRLRVYPGWNLCSLAVTAINTFSQLSTSNPQLTIEALYKWSPQTSNFVSVAVSETLASGTVLWLKASDTATLNVTGTYSEPTNINFSAGSAFIPSAGLEAWSVTSVLPTNVVAWKHDPQTKIWQTRFTGPLQSQSDLPCFVAPGEALFVYAEGAAQLQVPETALQIRYYHHDHLGSSAYVSAATAQPIEEVSFYAFGHPRTEFRRAGVQENYEFTQKERDNETGLQYFETRYLVGNLGRFCRADPLHGALSVLTNAALNALISIPQRLNPYAYVENNPMAWVDPSGLERIGLWTRGTSSGAFKGRAERGTKTGNLASFGTGQELIDRLKTFSEAGKMITQLNVHGHAWQAGLIGEKNDNSGLYIDIAIPYVEAHYGALSPGAAKLSELSGAILSGKIAIAKDGAINFFGCNTMYIAKFLSQALTAGGREDIKVTGSEQGVRPDTDVGESRAVSAGKFHTYQGGKELPTRKSMPYD